jgi:sec-independent protein translocase protein TatA
MKAGFWEILLIVILVLILFGHSKIPDLMKNLANGINIFKKELKGGDDKQSTEQKVEGGTVSGAEPVTSVKAITGKSVSKKSAVKKSSAKKSVAKSVAKKPAKKK